MKPVWNNKTYLIKQTRSAVYPTQEYIYINKKNRIGKKTKPKIMYKVSVGVF